VREDGRDHGDDLGDSLQLAQVAAWMVKPSEEAIERSPLIRNSRPMITTAIHTLTISGL